MVRIVQTASLLVASVLAGCAGAPASGDAGQGDQQPPPSPCTLTLDASFDAPPLDDVYAALEAGDPVAIEARLGDAYTALRERATHDLRAVDDGGEASEGSGDASGSDDVIRHLHAGIRDLSGRSGAPLRVGPTRFYLSEPLAALGFAAARQRGDDDAALAWLAAGGMGQGDSGRLGVCRIAMALDLGAPIDPAWVSAIDPTDPALADWMRWLRARGLAEPADVWARPVGAAP